MTAYDSYKRRRSLRLEQRGIFSGDDFAHDADLRLLRWIADGIGMKATGKTASELKSDLRKEVFGKKEAK